MRSSSESLNVAVTDVTKVFHTKPKNIEAVRGVNINLPAGGFLSLVGPSGCGKSTVLRMIADLDAPTSGQVRIGEYTPSQMVKRHEVGVAFQDSALLPWRSVRKNIEFGREMAKLPKDEKLINELLELVGLGAFQEARPAQLSGGMRQRVSLARALSIEPKLLLLDEPFGALDEFTRESLNLELQRIWMSRGVTTIMVTHSVSEAVFLSDTVITLTPRPSSVAAAISVPFPRPRTNELLTSAEFFEKCSEVSQSLSKQHGDAEHAKDNL